MQHKIHHKSSHSSVTDSRPKRGAFFYETPENSGRQRAYC